VTDVSVSPTHRRRGLLTAMMRRQLDELHGNSECLAVLYASEGGIYGRYGYAPASFCAHYVVDKRLCRLQPTRPEWAQGAGGSVVLIERDQATEVFPLVLAAHLPTRVGEVDRPKGEWAELLGEVTGPASGYRFYACYEQGGRIDGYAVYRVGGIDPADQWRRGVFLEELCTLSGAAYACLWQFLLGIDLTEELRTTGRPVDEPARFMLEDQRQWRTARWRDRTWVRLVDVKKALQLRRYEDEGVLVIEVSDPFCPWNEARLALSVDADGVATVEPCRSEPDIAVEAQVLSSLYLGAVAFDTMATVGQLQERRAGALRRADAMFAARRPPFCTTHF
jgi:predicted acetyltransferase